MYEQDEQDEQQLSAADQENIVAQAATAFDAGQAAEGAGDKAAAVSNYTEAAYLYLALRDERATEALTTLVQFVQTLDEDEFEGVRGELDEQHREMLDMIVSLVRQMDGDSASDDEDEDDGQLMNAANMPPEQQAAMLGQASSQLEAAKLAEASGETVNALAGYVEAAVIYIVLDQDEEREAALANFVGLLQTLDQAQVAEAANQLDDQHRQWLIAVMQMLQQRTIEEHEPEIRAHIAENQAAAEAALQSGDHAAALGALTAAFSNAASLQDVELAGAVLTRFGDMVDEVGPGEIAGAVAQMGEVEQGSFQMMLSALAEMRDPSSSEA